MAISAAPPNTMLMPTRSPSAQAAVLGSPARMISAKHQIDKAAHQHPAPAAGQFALVLEREHDRGHALDDEEGDQHQSERKGAADRPRQQQRTDQHGERGRDQRPPEARCVPHHEGGEQADHAAHQEKPTENERRRQRRQRRDDDGGRAEHQQHDAFDQKKHPMLVQRARDRALDLADIRWRGHGSPPLSEEGPAYHARGRRGQYPLNSCREASAARATGRANRSR